ncbi:hypothetical protein MGU_01077 [Metarhizium guizhouense ARSEF 977]|uniref:Uncharacterized protein n=1 Tax=Metarhizium guizhouense (strain ARSEF 977) TaxID=1276136 RepID=A0A0B4HPZ0_METGA|nr:hypothetical protein MGU_01077 [Metarhizium guizhouense ARSEF 977]
MQHSGVSTDSASEFDCKSFHVPARFLNVVIDQTSTIGLKAPARDVVRCEDVVFLDNVYEVSEFQGPLDDKKDELWDLLYRSRHQYHRHRRRSSQKATELYHGGSWNERRWHHFSRRLSSTALLGKENLSPPLVYYIPPVVFKSSHDDQNSLRKSLYPERFPDYSVFFQQYAN